MNVQAWSWLLTAVGLVGFFLAGRRVWWCWYINLACQGLWFTYAIVTKQYGFVASAIVYVIVFGNNAIKWTKSHSQSKKEPPLMASGEAVSGQISDRLRAQIPADDPSWNPDRDEPEPTPKPLPPGRDGWSVTGRGKRN